MLYEWYVTHALAGFKDFGVGVLIATTLWLYRFREEPSFLILFAGAFFALLPDADIVVPILRREYASDHHQLLTHFPAFMLGLIVPALWCAFGKRIAVLAFTGLFWHFVHDSPPLNGSWNVGGIAWFWPLSNAYWFFGWIPAPAEVGSAHKLWSTPSAFALWEMTAGTMALMLSSILLRSRVYTILGSVIVSGVWAATLMLWYVL